LFEYGLEHNKSIRILSMHDTTSNAWGNKYFPSNIFMGFGVKKTRFILNAVRIGIKSEVVILSHINLLAAAWLIKKISPSTKVILMAHGIEIWGTLSAPKKLMLRACDKIVAVSNYTKDRIIREQNIVPNKCLVLNNCIDPFLEKPLVKYRDRKLVDRYSIEEKDIVLLTLTRLSAKDRYKGYFSRWI
jgi:phosphatidyl-myo-inositol dimannoside synthase